MSVYVIPTLPAGRPFSWFLTCDPNRRHGGLLSAIDHESNRYYVAEHFAEGLPDRKHAEAYKRILASFRLIDGNGNCVPTMTIAADPGGAGAQAIINLADHGIFARAVPKDPGSVKASIELIRRAAWIDPGHRHPITGQLGAPHCYFLQSLRSTWTVQGVEYNESRLMWELRQYRQKEGGKPDEPVKENDDLVDCMRYLELVRPFAPVPVDTSELDERRKIDGLSRKASEEFDDLVKRAQRKRPQSGEEKFW